MHLLTALSVRTGREDAELVPERMRREMSTMSALTSPVRTTVRAVDRLVPGPDSPIPVRIYRPLGAVADLPAIVFAHGGGFVNGGLGSHDPTCRLLADVARCVVVAVDYRLAPEHRFPAAVDDVVAAYRWVLDHTGELGILPGAVGAMGDSAGATLTAVLCLEARRLGLPQPVAQCLVYPLTDLHMRAPSYTTFAEGFGLTKRNMDWYREQYAPDPATWDDPRLSPLLADDHSGLAPAFVVTAGFDPLRDDGEAYADALRAAGVPVTYRCYDDMIHAFHGVLVLPDAAAAATEIDAFMGALLRP
jgi:acetyl esterase